MLSNVDKAVKIAYEKGYRVVKNKVISPFGGFRKVGIRSTNGYKFARFSLTFKDEEGNKISRGIPVHKLMAFQKFGSKVFRPDVEIRHLNGDSLDNSEVNIGIGSRSDNAMDKAPEVRLEMSIKAATKLRKFTDKEMDEIREFHRGSYKETMEQFSV